MAREGQAPCGAANGHQPAGTLLGECRPVLARIGQPSMCGAECRVAGKWKFRNGSENPHPVVRGTIGRREHKGRFRQVGPGGDLLHLFIANTCRFQDHAHRVTEVGSIGENVDLHECSRCHLHPLSNRAYVDTVLRTGRQGSWLEQPGPMSEIMPKAPRAPP